MNSTLSGLSTTSTHKGSPLLVQRYYPRHTSKFTSVASPFSCCSRDIPRFQWHSQHKPFIRLTKSSTCECVLTNNVLMCVTSQKIQQNSKENRARQFSCSKKRLPHLHFQLCMDNYCVHAQTPKLAHRNRKSYIQVENLQPLLPICMQNCHQCSPVYFLPF